MKRRSVEEELRERERLLWLADHPGVKPREYRRIKNSEEVKQWHAARREAHMAAVRQAWERDHPNNAYPESELNLTARWRDYVARWQRAFTRQLLASRRKAR